MTAPRTCRQCGAAVVVVLVGSGSVVGGLNPASLWFLSGYVVAATLILKQTWTRVKIPAAEVGAPQPPAGHHARHPVLLRPIPPRVLFGGLALMGAAAVFAVTRSMSAGDLFLPIAVLVTTGVGLFLAWLSGV